MEDVNCYSVLLDFLRFSRSTIDDSINQNLNALQTLSNTTPDPVFTRYRSTGSSRRQLNSESCRSFCEAQLFPAWHARTLVLQYCSTVAAGSDSEDPEFSARADEIKKNQSRIINDRQDPYSSRITVTESRTERLTRIIREETSIEEIVRRRTWDAVTSRCSSSPSMDWESSFSQWRKSSQQKLDVGCSTPGVTG